MASAEVPKCKVCGDTAGCGINFGCLSCESCKAFFRRRSCSSSSASSNAQCPFSGQCRITAASRRACQACRLAKCLQVGMRKELVDAWKRAKRADAGTLHPHEGTLHPQAEEVEKDERKIRRKRRMKETEEEDKDEMEDEGKEEELAPQNAKNVEGERHRSCASCKCCCAKRQMRDAGTQTTDTMDKASGNQGIRSEPSTNQNVPMAMDAEDRALLDELIRANSVMDAPLLVPDQLLPLFNPTLMDALRVSEWGMRRMVTMFKQLAAFRALPQADQIALLRARLLELLLLRGAMAFDPVNEVWRHAVAASGGGGGAQHAPATMPFQLKFNVFPATEQHQQEHKRFLFTFGEQWRTNRDVMLIMHAIVLFSPRDDSHAGAESSSSSSHNVEPPQLLASGQVRAHRERYCTLLRRYLRENSAQRAEMAYTHLLGKLGELAHLNASFQRIYLQLQSQSELLEEPLLKELFSTLKK